MVLQDLSTDQEKNKQTHWNNEKNYDIEGKNWWKRSRTEKMGPKKWMATNFNFQLPYYSSSAYKRLKMPERAPNEEDISTMI